MIQEMFGTCVGTSEPQEGGKLQGIDLELKSSRIRSLIRKRKSGRNSLCWEISKVE